MAKQIMKTGINARGTYMCLPNEDLTGPHGRPVYCKHRRQNGYSNDDMLKAVAVENFVHFKDRQILHFDEPGPYFIVGPNGSGKTSFFELIRRCMSSSINHSWSSVHDKERPGCVVCKFDMGDKPYRPEQTPTGDKHLVFAAIVYKDEHIYKVCQIQKKMSENIYEPTELYVEKYPYTTSKKTIDQDNMVHYTLTEGHCLSKHLGDMVNNKTQNCQDLVDEIIKLIGNIEAATANNIKGRTIAGEADKSECEVILEYITTNHFVATFSAHGLSRIQWTRSKTLLDRNHREDNYNLAINSAEILQTLLENTEDIDDKREKEYFSILTHPSTYTFTKKGTEIRVKDESFVFDLLKIPNGVLQAKHMSLLLAHRREFQTICLDDPDQGMHPQMISRMRDLVFRRLDFGNKTILIQLNNQLAISHWHMDRTFVFRRPRSENTIVRRTTLIKPHHHDGILRVPFASYVLFVEGPDDKAFITLMFDQALANPTILDTICQKDQHVVNELRCFISNLDIVEMVGAKNAAAMENIARQLHMLPETFFLMDRDTMCDPILTGETKAENKTRVDGVLGGITNPEQFCDKAEELRECTVLKYHQPSNTPINKQIYIWSNGDLEETIRVEILDRKKQFQEGIELQFGNDRTKILNTLKSPFAKKKFKDFEEQVFLARFVAEGNEGETLFQFLKTKMETLRPQK